MTKKEERDIETFVNNFRDIWDEGINVLDMPELSIHNDANCIIVELNEYPLNIIFTTRKYLPWVKGQYMYYCILDEDPKWEFTGLLGTFSLCFDIADKKNIKKCIDEIEKIVLMIHNLQTLTKTFETFIVQLLNTFKIKGI